MEVFAARLGRVEVAVESVRQELLAAQIAAQPAAEPGAGGGVARVVAAAEAQGAAQAEWVRLFEKELVHLRREVKASSDAVQRMEARVRQVEDESASPADLEELAEIILKELREVRGGAFGGLTSIADFSGGFSGRRQEHRREAFERLASLEASVTRSAELLQVIEREMFLGAAPSGEGSQRPGGPYSETDVAIGAEAPRSFTEGHFVGARAPPGAAPRGGGTLAARVQQLEEDVQLALEPLRRHMVSLRALEETSSKIEELKSTLAGLPTAKTGIPEGASGGGGGLSLLDGYRVQMMVEQAMIAVEALARQRNDDVKLVNSYLGEVYARIERDLDRDYGVAHAAPFLELRAQVVSIAAKLDGLSSVALQELEERVLHESRVAQEAAKKAGQQILELGEEVRSLSDIVAEHRVRVDSVASLVESRSLLATRSESLALEAQRDLQQLRIEVTALMSGSSGVGVGGGTVQLEARLSVVRAELEAQLQRHAREMGRHATSLAKEVEVIRERHEDIQASAGIVANWREELVQLTRDISELRGSSLRADMELRERVAHGERELRAEIRAAQGLMLEVAEQLRATGGRAALRANASAIVSSLSAEASGAPQLGDLAGEGAGALSAKGNRAGKLAIVAEGVLEWRVPGVRGVARACDRTMLVSAPFSVPRSSAMPHLENFELQLQLFPLGSRRRTEEGFCSLYISAPEGLHLQFLLSLGAAEHGPMECYFDRPNKITGRHDFCALEEQLEADGSAVVGFTVLQVDFVPVASRSASAAGGASSTVRF